MTTITKRQLIAEVFAHWDAQGMFRNCETKRVTSVKAGTPTPWRGKPAQEIVGRELVQS